MQPQVYSCTNAERNLLRWNNFLKTTVKLVPSRPHPRKVSLPQGRFAACG
jgi:hypothetical protein